jgi:hypothetical protein
VFKFALLIFLISISNAFACGVSTKSYVNLAISTVEEKIFSYGVKDIDENLPSSVVSNCRDTAAKRRFVMITFGPEMIAQNNSIRGTNFDKIYDGETSCSIENNPLKKLQTASDLKSNFDSKWKFINECVEITVLEKGPRPLSYPLDQTGCKITKNSNQSASFNGGFCLFKPNAESEFHISTSVKESCKKLSAYKQFGIELLDLEASINYYTSSTYKDEFSDLSSFGTSSLRLSVNPLNTLFRASDDFGILRPTFPEDYPVNDMHLGKIEIEDQGEKNVFIKTPLIVSNFCKSVEKDGLKSSICDYLTPFAGEVKLINSKGQVEATWYDGGIAPAQWQGILNGEGQRLSKELLRKNENYKIEISFSDPYFEFNTFKKKLVSKLKATNLRLPIFYAGDGISEIPSIESMGEIDQMVSVGGVGDISFPSSIKGLDSERRRLSAYYSTSLFPPMYSKACHPETGVCENTGKAFVKFTASFKVAEDYSISDLEVERSSKILGSYKKKISKQPEYICK